MVCPPLLSKEGRGVVCPPLLSKEGRGVVCPCGLPMKIHNLRTRKILRQNLRNNVLMPERILWKYLKNKQHGYKFRRQHGVGNYVVDFYCPQLCLIVEIEGKVHGEIIDRDKKRYDYFNELGLNLKKYTAQEIDRNLFFVLEDLLQFCNVLADRQTPPRLPLERGGS